MAEQQITTAEELDALPVGSVVLDENGSGGPFVKSSPWHDGQPPVWVGDYLTGASPYDDFEFPVTVLYRPDAPAPVDQGDREVAARALEEAAEALDGMSTGRRRESGYGLAGAHIIARLRERADRVRRGEG